MYILMLSPSFGSLLKENGFDEIVSWSLILDQKHYTLFVDWLGDKTTLRQQKEIKIAAIYH